MEAAIRGLLAQLERMVADSKARLRWEHLWKQRTQRYQIREAKHEASDAFGRMS